MEAPTTINWRERITADPAIMVGQPVIRGMRITVALILECLASGWTEAEVLDAYPDLESEDIRACLGYALLLVNETTLSMHPAA